MRSANFDYGLLVGRPLSLLCLLLTACALPENVLYRCEPDQTCTPTRTTCWSDGFCHHGTEPNLFPDAGMTTCTPHPRPTQCSSVQCGAVTDGCDGSYHCDKPCGAGLHCKANQCVPASLCDEDGWCWENPLPQGASLLASFALDGRHRWFAGTRHTVLFFDGDTFSLQAISAERGVSILSIHAATPSEVYAVGSNGLIAHFDGERWQREGTLETFGGALSTVLAIGDGGAFAAGDGGIVLIRSAPDDPFSRWSDDHFPDAGAVRALLLRGGVPLAVTHSGAVLSRLDGIWRLTDSIHDAARAATVRHDTLLISTTTAVLASDGDGGWLTIHDAGADLLIASPLGVHALSADQLVLISDAGASVALTEPWRTGLVLDGRFFGAGDDGRLAWLDFDGGVQWRSTPPVGTVTSFCEGAATFTDGWLEQTAMGWQAHALDAGRTSAWLSCFSEENRRWFTGNAGLGVVVDASGTQVIDFGTAGRITGVWGSADAGYTFPRVTPLPLMSGGPEGPFTERDVHARASLWSVWGDGSDVVLVGDDGELVHFDGAQWQHVDTGTTATLRHVHGVGGNYLAVGDEGVVLRFDGGVPSVMTVPQAPPLVGVFGSWFASADTVWITSVDGGCTELPLETPGEIHAVGEHRIGGTGGMILHHP